MDARKEPDVTDRRPASGRLTDKAVIVTGSTSGIGKACAILFAWEGAKVTVAGRRKDAGTAVVDRIKRDGGKAVFVNADITREADRQAIVNDTLEAFGSIDGLLNNAGCLISKPTLELTREDWDKFTDLDGYSYLRMMQLVIPQMERQGGGTICNCTSLAAIDNDVPGGALYCFVKAGVNHMTHCIAKEFIGKGIRINNLCPGLVETEMVLSGPGAADFDAIVNRLPAGRAATALEMAYGALYLLSDESAYTSGTSLVIDSSQRGY